MNGNFELIKNEQNVPVTKCAACGHDAHRDVCRHPVRTPGKLFSHAYCGCQPDDLKRGIALKKAA